MIDATWKWKLTDKRTADRYIEKGLVSREDFDKQLKALPDDSANATWVEMSLEETDLNDSMDDDDSDRPDRNRERTAQDIIDQDDGTDNTP